ncbi:MAG: hypothetical protein WDZ35_16150 [Crocinitomicaceae bacterium]
MFYKDVGAGIVSKIDEQIIKIVYTDAYEIEKHHAKEIADAFYDACEGKPAYCLTDMQGQYNAFTAEAQKYLSNEAPVIRKKLVLASAIVVDNLANRLIAKFFITFYKPAYPAKVFKSNEEGLAWLNELKEKKAKK